MYTLQNGRFNVVLGVPWCLLAHPSEAEVPNIEEATQRRAWPTLYWCNLHSEPEADPQTGMFGSLLNRNGAAVRT